MDIEKYLTKLVNNEEVVKKFGYAYSRWQDEKEYEDFAEYVVYMIDAITKNFDRTIKLVSGSQKPFGLMLKKNNHIIKLHTKRKGNSIILIATY